MLFKKGERTTGELCCEIIRPVSKGPMAELYLAVLIGTEHKLMVKAAGQNEIWQNNLKQEAALLTGLRHVGIPEIFDFVKDVERSYYIMSYHEGITLAQYMQRYSKISQQTVHNMAKALCKILDYLHDREVPIIHGDIKPANILLQNDELVLLDFGAARAMTNKLQDVYFQGTLGYAAPECWHQKSGDIKCAERNAKELFCVRTKQDSRQQICPATDIFALGATMYYLLEGREPQHCFGQYELSDCPESKKNRWQPVLKRCTALDIRDRYQSAAELYHDLTKMNVK